MWYILLKRYWQVTILQETPANTPYSFFLLSLITIIYLLILFLQWLLVATKNHYSISNILFTEIIPLLSCFIYTKIILYLYKKGNRFIQTITALLMSSLIIHSLALPFLLVALYLLQTDVEQIMLLFIIIYLFSTFILGIWQFLAIIHIFRCALESSFLVAIITSFGLLAINLLIISTWQ